MNKSWKIFFFDVFNVQIQQLASEVSALKIKDPTGYKSHPKTKLLAKVWSVIRDQIAKNPKSDFFHLGKTLPKKYRVYKRAKSGLPDRYRLFFRYRTDEENIIILWMNDEFTLRKAGSKNDVYNVFLKMLANKEIPPNWKDLLKKSKKNL